MAAMTTLGRVQVPAVHAIGIERIVHGDHARQQGSERRQIEVDVQSKVPVRRHQDQVDETAPQHHARHGVGGAGGRPFGAKSHAAPCRVGQRAGSGLDVGNQGDTGLRCLAIRIQPCDPPPPRLPPVRHGERAGRMHFATFRMTVKEYIDFLNNFSTT